VGVATTDASTPSGTFRLLVVAAEEISGGALRDAVREHVEGRETAVRLIAPALTESGLEHAMGDVDDALVAARERLEHEEAEREFEPPITELFVERHEGGEPTVAQVEHIGPGRRAEPGEREPESRNLPPFSPRDLAGILVAIVGTIVLVVIAASGSDDLSGAGGLSSQSVQILIAGGMGLVNLAHVVGLTLFQTVSYRGLGPDFFARLSLYGTPIAIVISVLLG
jgi:hypothetical protein